MGIQTLDQLTAALAISRRQNYFKTTLTSVAGAWTSEWRSAGLPGVGLAPTTLNGEIPTRLTGGTFDFPTTPEGKTNYLARALVTRSIAGTTVVYDRLYHNVFDVTSLAEQTIVMPGATRYPEGNGVELWAEGYVAGTAATPTITVSYTNQDGVAGRLATLVGITLWPTNRMLRFVLQEADSGVQSVQSVTMGTAYASGSLGLVLVRRIAEVPVITAGSGMTLDGFGLGLPEVKADAALATLIFTSTTSTGSGMGSFDVIQG